MIWLLWQMQEIPRRYNKSCHVANWLKQSGRATEESIPTQEDAMAHYTALLQDHKKEAQSGLEYYRRLRSETECNYKHLCILQQKNITPGRLVEIKRLKQTSLPLLVLTIILWWGRTYPTGVSQPSPCKRTMYIHDEACVTVMSLVSLIIHLVTFVMSVQLDLSQLITRLPSLTTFTSCILTCGCDTLPSLDNG